MPLSPTLQRWRKRLIKKARSESTGPSESTSPLSTSRMSLDVTNSPIEPHCLFLTQLTFDVRRLIYHAVWDTPCFHVVTRRAAGGKRRLAYLSCQAFDGVSHAPSGCWGTQLADSSFGTRQYLHDGPADALPYIALSNFRGFNTTDADVLPLMLSCKTIYAEYTQVLFQECTFAFRDSYAFNLFSSRLAPSNLSILRHLHVQHMSLISPVVVSIIPAQKEEPDFSTQEQWDSFWDSVQELKGLKSLEVVIVDRPAFWYRNRTAQGFSLNIVQPEQEPDDFGLLDALRAVQRSLKLDRLDITLNENFRLFPQPEDKSSRLRIRQQENDPLRLRYKNWNSVRAIEKFLPDA